MPLSEVLTEVTICRQSNRRTINCVTSRKLASLVEKNDRPPLILEAEKSAAMLIFETVKMPRTSACSKAEHYGIIGLALGPRAHQ